MKLSHNPFQKSLEELFQPIPCRRKEYESRRRTKYGESYYPSTTLPFPSTERNPMCSNGTDGTGVCQPSSDCPVHSREEKRLYRRRTIPNENSKHKSRQDLHTASSHKRKHDDNMSPRPWEGLLRLLHITEAELSSFQEEDPRNRSPYDDTAATMDTKYPIASPSSFGRGFDAVTSIKKRSRDYEHDDHTQTYANAETTMGYDLDENDGYRKRRGPKGGSSRYRGVGITKSGRWRAVIYDCRKQRYLGLFDVEEDAAREYDRAAREIFGEYANLNFNPLTPSIV